MKAQELLDDLIRSISDADWRRLETGDDTLFISQWNRKTLLRIHAFQPTDHEIPDARIEALKLSLSDYLDRYMPDRPEGHRWIVLSCLFLAFVAREPLHPGEIVRHRQVIEAGETVHRCPAREDHPESLCRFCVCKRETKRG